MEGYMCNIFKINRLMVVLVFLFILSPTNNLLAEIDHLYLVSGTPTPKADAPFPVVLYNLDKGEKTLNNVREVVGKENIELIRPYYDEKLISIINFKYGKDNERCIINLIDMNYPLKSKSFQITYPRKYSYIRSGLHNIPEEGIYYVIDVSHRGDSQLIGLNIHNGMHKKLKSRILSYKIVYGIPGSAIPGGDYLSVYPDFDDALGIRFGRERIKSNWKLPKSIQFDKRDRIVIHVNNKDMLALASIKTRVRNEKGLGHTKFHVLNKETGKWQMVQFQGGSTSVRSFGNKWLAGYVEEKGGGRKSPGHEKRRKEMTKTGTPFEWRANGKYIPGILFLYNVDTKKKYEWDTGQGDSEVLLVDGGTVYYRVNDEIYKAKVGKAKIENPELLVKDEVVPDIHWAFIGPAVDAQK
jgi:hypothetical protein